MVGGLKFFGLETRDIDYAFFAVAVKKEGTDQHVQFFPMCIKQVFS